MNKFLPFYLLCLFVPPLVHAGTTLSQSAADCYPRSSSAAKSGQMAIERLCTAENFWIDSGNLNLLTPRSQYLATPLFAPQDDVSTSSAGNFFLNRLSGSIAVGYDDTSMGRDFSNSEYYNSDYSVAGNLGYLINDNFSLDFAAGRFSGQDFRQEQMLADPYAAALGDSNYLFYSGNLNGIWIIDQWSLGAHIGYLASRDYQTSYISGDETASATNQQDTGMWQWHSGVDLAYAFQSSFEPYIGVGYLKNNRRELSTYTSGTTGTMIGDDEYRFSAGLRYLGKNGFSSNLKFNVSSDREEIDFSSLTLLLRLDL